MVFIIREYMSCSCLTMKYKKKLRLLVTNKCSKNCPYCHNEGMAKWPLIHLEPAKLKPFLPDIKKYTNRIVLSGGEPFEYEHLQELTALLSSYGFDISLISANIDKTQMAHIGHLLKSIHVSLHGIDDLEADSALIYWLNNTYPNIRISLNIPFGSINTVQKNWEKLYRLALDVGANLQFIRLFICGQSSATLWTDRWWEMEHFLSSRARFMEATEREMRYITEDLIKIDLLDIPCLASGADFADGACLNNSDLTIDPDLRLSICRWTSSAVPLYEENRPLSLDTVIRRATEKSCQKCMYGAINGYFHADELDHYLNAPHYLWPGFDSELSDVFTRTFVRDLSYYGKSGTVALLENEFSNYINAKYTLAVNAGTTAVYLACMALGLSSEDEVLIPVATFPTLVAALLSAGVRVRLCDIDSITGNISLDSLRERMGPGVKAVLVTHLWGLPVDMEAVREICRPYGAYVIEDCSHAYGAEFNGRKVGSFGDISCFSLQANKAVYAGEGGLLVTSNRLFYERAVTLSASVERVLDCVKNVDYLKYWGTGLGLKLKLNPLGAPLALMSLGNLEEVNRKRRHRAMVIEAAAKDSGIFNILSDGNGQCKRVYYTYKLILRDQYIPYRDAVLRFLIHHGLEACTTSFIPAYEHEICSDPRIVNAQDPFPNSEIYYKRVISLPAFVYEPVALVEHYAEIIREAAKMIVGEKACKERQDTPH